VAPLQNLTMWCSYTQVLVQVIKQLRDNPTTPSLERGWCLLLLCLDSFPPSDAAENYIEYFLRARNMLPCVLSLHKTLYVNGFFCMLDHFLLLASESPVGFGPCNMVVP
jgi:hypothetical protein